MYVDSDMLSRISIMELAAEEADVILNALVRLATSPDIPGTEREIARQIALKISREHGQPDLLPITRQRR